MKRYWTWLNRRRIALYLVGLPGAFLLLAAGMIVSDGLTDELAVVDVALVLGNRVEDDGTPSARLRARLDKAVQLYERGYFTTILVSGGTDRNGTNEGLVMKAYLVAQGIPGEDILVDRGGYNTYLTARHAARRMAANGYESVMVISQHFHIARSRLALQRFGVQEIYAAHADYVELRDLYSAVREVVAYGYYLVRPYN